jgi:hypothetical protein
VKHVYVCDVLTFNAPRLSSLIDQCHPEKYVRDHVRLSMWNHWRGKPEHLPIIIKDINPNIQLPKHATSEQMREALINIGITAGIIASICKSIETTEKVPKRPAHHKDYFARREDRKKGGQPSHYWKARDERTQPDNREYAVRLQGFNY